MSMTYLQHEHAAVMELRNHILNCKHTRHVTDIEKLDEADLAEEALYSDGSQVKFLPNNILKIKWESHVFLGRLCLASLLLQTSRQYRIQRN